MTGRNAVGTRAMGGYVPERVVTNADLEKTLDTSDEWIRRRIGIVTRRYSAPDEGTSDLAVRAVADACERAEVHPDTIDLIICGTSTPDHMAPPTALAVARKLEL